jgi:hypothetical protein
MPSTLEVLALRQPRYLPAEGGVLLFANTEWRLVHTLGISWLTVPLSELVRAFPNVRSLIIKGNVNAKCSNTTDIPVVAQPGILGRNDNGTA